MRTIFLAGDGMLRRVTLRLQGRQPERVVRFCTVRFLDVLFSKAIGPSSTVLSGVRRRCPVEALELIVEDSLTNDLLSRRSVVIRGYRDNSTTVNTGSVERCAAAPQDTVWVGTIATYVLA